MNLIIFNSQNQVSIQIYKLNSKIDYKIIIFFYYTLYISIILNSPIYKLSILYLDMYFISIIYNLQVFI